MGVWSVWQCTAYHVSHPGGLDCAFASYSKIRHIDIHSDEIAAAAMVDIEVVFHAYSAADRAKIDDGMKRYGIGILLLDQPSAQLIVKVCYVCGLWLNYSIIHFFCSLYLTRSASDS
jgi:hypothetical protein